MSIIDDLISNPKLINDVYSKYEEKFFKGEPLPDRKLPIYDKFCIYGASVELANGSKLDVVKWKDAHVTFYESYGDVISFEFSGCVMGRIRWNNRTYAVHIHNSDAQHPNQDQRLHWSHFVRSQGIRDISMFRPGSDDMNSLDRNIEICGVITSTGGCYSVYANYDRNTKEYLLYKIQEHPSYGVDVRAYQQILNLPTDSTYNTVSNAWNTFWNVRRSQLLYSLNP